MQYPLLETARCDVLWGAVLWDLRKLEAIETGVLAMAFAFLLACFLGKSG